jgi:hypothetical protein
MNASDYFGNVVKLSKWHTAQVRARQVGNTDIGEHFFNWIERHPGAVYIEPKPVLDWVSTNRQLYSYLMIPPGKS